MTSPAAASCAPATRPATADAASVAVVLLSAIVPFAAFLSSNATKINHPAEVASFALIWTASTVAAFFGVRLITRSTKPMVVAAGFAVVNLSFWNVGRLLPPDLDGAGPAIGFVLVWALVTAAIVRLVTSAASDSWFRTFILLFLSIWTVASLLGYVTGRAAVDGGTPEARYAGPSPSFVERPNVYWFVLDEHARSDQVQRWTGSDDSWFAEDLRSRGFGVSDSSLSAYAHTELSVPSTLAMEYVVTPGNDYRSTLLPAAEALSGDNSVVQIFEENGYRFVSAPAGSVDWASCPEPVGDRVCIEPVGGEITVREPIANVLDLSALGLIPFPTVYQDPGSVMAGIRALPVDGRPNFVFAHLLSPHHPHRYETDCSYRDPFVSGSGYTGEQRAAAYATDVACLDRAMVDTVDEIIAADPDAVIVIQSDHGSRLSFEWGTPYEQWSDQQLLERFAVINAMRLPESCRGRDVEGMPLVNTFRLIFACLSGTEPDLLPTRSFFSDHSRIDTLVEVPPARLDGE